MKKIFVTVLAIASIFSLPSCQKEYLSDSANNTATISVSYEDVIDSETKAVISEGDTSFSILWSGDETMYLGNNLANTNSVSWNMDSHDGKSAVFSGSSFPAATYKEGDETKTAEEVCYFGVVSSFASATNSVMRGAIASTQEYAGTNIAKNALLVGKTPAVAPGTSTTMEIRL